LFKLLRRIAKTVLNIYPGWICKREYESQSFSRFNERPIEFGFVFKKLGEIYPRTILDVGTGTTALPHLMRNCGFIVTAIDNVRDYWPAGMINRHYHVIDDDISETRLTTKFDLITCISVLEHIQNPRRAVEKMFSLLNPNGHLILTAPYTETSYVRNVYELAGSSYGQGASYITQPYSRKELDEWLQRINGVIVDQEYWQYWEGEHWTVGKQIIPPKAATVNDRHQLTCLLVKKQVSTGGP
jgi:SAM-dependent methyltransferase